MISTTILLDSCIRVYSFFARSGVSISFTKKIHNISSVASWGGGGGGDE